MRQQVSGLDDLNELLNHHSMMAGWNKSEPSLWSEPRITYRSSHWRWADARLGLSMAGSLISTDLADRRNLFLVNPIDGNNYSTLRTLVCAYQMIRPGERARSHRHSPHALRLALEASRDVYTVVDGQRVDIRTGDVVLTSGWAWHGHANDGPEDAYWIDFLDVPLVHLMEPMFLEHWPDGFQKPEEGCDGTGEVLVFRWVETKTALEAAIVDKPSAKLVLDAKVLPTMELSMTAIRGGARTEGFQSTDNKIITVVEGTGRTRAGDQEFQWVRGDVMAIPGWVPLRHEAETPSTLFQVSDARAQGVLGYFRTRPVP